MTYLIYEVSDKIPFCEIEAENEKEALLKFQSSRCVSQNGTIGRDNAGRLVLKKNRCWYVAVQK